MVVTVFRSRLRADVEPEYSELAAKTAALAKTMSGYLSHKSFTAEDGERVTIVEFLDHDAQRAWSAQVEHVAAKKRGRDVFYSEYTIQICDVVRESRFPKATIAGLAP